MRVRVVSSSRETAAAAAVRNLIPVTTKKSQINERRAHLDVTFPLLTKVTQPISFDEKQQTTSSAAVAADEMNKS